MVLLLAGLAGMFLLTVLNRPVEVTAEDCVRFWNSTLERPDLVPDDRVVRLLAEDEQDLGYALCHLYWQGDDRACNAFSVNIWKDTDSWDGAVLHSCDSPLEGTSVRLGLAGMLAIDE